VHGWGQEQVDVDGGLGGRAARAETVGIVRTRFRGFRVLTTVGLRGRKKEVAEDKKKKNVYVPGTRAVVRKLSHHVSGTRREKRPTPQDLNLVRNCSRSGS